MRSSQVPREGVTLPLDKRSFEGRSPGPGQRSGRRGTSGPMRRQPASPDLIHFARC